MRTALAMLLCFVTLAQATDSRRGLYVYTEYAETEDYAGIDITDAITIIAWIDPISYADYRPIVDKFYDGTRAYGLTIYGTSPNGELYAVIANSTGAGAQVSGTSSGFGGVSEDLCCAAVTWDKTDGPLRFYKNGEAVSSTGSGTQTMNANNQPLRIGVDYSGSIYFYGSIGSVQIYDRALSAEEIRGHYNHNVCVTNEGVNIVSPSAWSGSTNNLVFDLDTPQAYDTGDTLTNDTQIVNHAGPNPVVNGTPEINGVFYVPDTYQ